MFPFLWVKENIQCDATNELDVALIQHSDNADGNVLAAGDFMTCTVVW